jgi:tRNA threonylcarbamoyladenosine biosynthesis protein TsaB
VTTLALDTTTEFGSVALRTDGKLVGERHVHSSDGFAHVIFQQIEALLAESSQSVPEIDCFAAGAGPGSFTGVRVGLTAAKGLAEAWKKPVAAVSSLRALAAFGDSERRAVVLDARRGEVYAAVYDAELNLLEPEIVLKFSEWLHGLTADNYEFITATSAPFKSMSTGTRFAEMRWTEAPRSVASAVALCAELDAATGKLVDPVAADANYVRRSDAELLWKE